jgi:hypothetical protein
MASIRECTYCYIMTPQKVALGRKATLVLPQFNGHLT